MERQLHRLIPNEQLPACLKRPLVFGDDEQISALYDLRSEIEKIEAEQEDLKNGNLRTFYVTVEVVGEKSMQIDAISGHAAKEKAMEILDILDCDFETSAWAREIKK